MIIRKHRGRRWIWIRETSAKGGTGRGSFIRRDRWNGPRTVAGLRAAGFLPLPTRDDALVAADWLEDNDDPLCTTLRDYVA